MARGIGGDDGPSLFMMAACVLIWYKLSDMFKAGKDAVEDELNTNHAGVFQQETSSDIKRMEKTVSGIAYRSSKLTKPKANYTSIADALWVELKAKFNTDEGKMFDLLTPLNADELKCVAKEFGVRETNFLGFTTATVTLFNAFDQVLTDGLFSKDLTSMHSIWKKTGLW